MEPKNFLEKIQNADERTKRRYIFGSAVVLTVVLAYVWLAYFQSITVNLASPATAPDSGGFTFFDTMKSGMATLYGFFTDKLHAFSEILKTPRDYLIKPPQ